MRIACHLSFVSDHHGRWSLVSGVCCHHSLVASALSLFLVLIWRGLRLCSSSHASRRPVTMDPNAVNYQQQQQQPPPPHVSSKGIWITKLIFRILAAIFAIILIGLAAGLATFDGESLEDDSDYYYGYDYYGYWAAGPLIVLLPPVCHHADYPFSNSNPAVRFG